MKWAVARGLVGAFIGYGIGVQLWNVLVNFEIMAPTVSVPFLAAPYGALMAWASYRGGTIARWCWGAAIIGGIIGMLVVVVLAPRAPVEGIINDGLFVTGPVGTAVGAVFGAVIGAIRQRWVAHQPRPAD
jgi:hypothetical protein